MKICVVTTTRADYGLLYPLIKRMKEDSFFNFNLVASGTHLSKKFGYTKKEIVKDGFTFDEINILSKFDFQNTPSKIFARTVKKFEKFFNKNAFDYVMVLGDRFEILAVSTVCLLKNIPLFHISGGDVTFGAIDDACRHSISKMSCLHFTGSEEMRKRVVQLGENPNTVFNVGELGVENCLNTKTLSLSKINAEFGFNLKEKEFVILTYHPQSVGNIDNSKILLNILSALSEINIDVMCTKTNIDDGGMELNNILEERARTNERLHIVSSFGRVKYLSLVKYSAFVIGNSSSGLVEVPYLNVSTINIGHRQDGRFREPTVFDVEGDDKQEIIDIITKILNPVKNPINITNYYGDGETSDKIIKVLKSNFKLEKFKNFYDLEVKE